MTEYKTTTVTSERPSRDWAAVRGEVSVLMLLVMFAAMTFAALELHRVAAANADASKQLQIAVNQLTLEQSIANRRRPE